MSLLGAPNVWVSGSLAYRGGSQFGSSSDVDLVVESPGGCVDALSRSKWIRDFLARKEQQEVDLLRALRRRNADDPIASAQGQPMIVDAGLPLPHLV